VFLPNWIGDTTMATAALRWLRAELPDCRLIGVARPGPAQLLHGTPLLDEILTYRPRGRPPQLNRRGLVRQLRGRRSEAAILLTDSLGTAALAVAAGCRRRIGLTGDGRTWLLTDRIPKTNQAASTPPDPCSPDPCSPESTVDRYLRIGLESVRRLTGRECDPPPEAHRRLELAVEPEGERRWVALRQQLGFTPESPMVVINNASAGSPSRLLPEPQLLELVRRLASELGCQVLLHCGPADRHETNRWADLVGLPQVASMGVAEDLPLGLSKAVLGAAAVVISTDSGPRLIASALGRPVIGLYGSTDPGANRTYQGVEISLSVGLDCQPCWQKICPLQHHACMRQFPIDSVIAQVARRIEPTAAPQSPPAAQWQLAAGTDKGS
jgi:heptosyltransferase II